MASIEKFRVNKEIRARKVRLIGEDGEQIGIVSLDEALGEALKTGLDLVEVASDGDPPVCRLMDYGKLKYDNKKKQQESRKKQHVIRVKEVRFRPRISDNDFETKIKSAKKFLQDGCKLKITIMFRGREMARQDLGAQLLKRIEAVLDGVAEVEKRGEMEGRRFSVLMAPK